jgi:cytidylate kinase
MSLNSKKRLIIAIDGPAGAGKSSVAKSLAQRLNYLYIDTGAMYRAVTFKAMQAGIDLSDGRAVEDIARTVKLEFVAGQAGVIYMDGADVSAAIRTPEVSRNVSAYVASYPGVRQKLVELQQAMGAPGGVVMEGRDITTVVFPRAEVKVFLDAGQEERACRRFEELRGQGREQSYNELLADLKRRDQEDRNRPGGALQCVPDALVLDSTRMSIDQVVDAILQVVHEKAALPE